MKIEYAGICFQGLVRKNNEDNIYINGEYLDRFHGDSSLYTGIINEGTFAVFDGMGGEADGEVASYIAASNLSMHDLWEINRMVCDHTRRQHLRFCGATAAVLSVEPDQITASNLGDSRIYHWQESRLKQVSQDHIRSWRGRRYITQSLGVSSFIVEPYAVSFAPASGEKYLLCSDGLTDMLTDEMISRYLSQSPKEAVQQLRDAVMETGAIDNTTIIIIEIREA